MSCSRLVRMLPLVVLVSCADDGDGSGGTDTSTGGESGMPGTAGSGSSSTSDGSASSSGRGSTGAVDSTTEGSASSSGGEESSSGSTGRLTCEDLPPGPFPATEFFAVPPFAGSDDFAFDGAGNLAGKFNNSLVLVDATGAVLDQAQDLGAALGLRFRSNQEIVIAHVQAQSIDLVSFSDTSFPLLEGAGLVNGIHVDELDQVWFTNLQIVGRISADGTPTPLVTGPAASGANGIVYDPYRTLLFYTNYNQGTVRRVAVNPEGKPGPAEILVEIEGAPQLDGMALDGCGNIYVVDGGNSDIYRIRLDDHGALIGRPESILEEPTPTNISNIRFGPGPDFDTSSLFAVGGSGVVYRIETGVGMYGVG
jgi:hypothetical protein